MLPSAAIFFIFYMYRVHQKQCSKFSNEKSLVFLTVNLNEILQASTYMVSIVTYIKSKNPPRLVCGRQPPRAASDQSGTCAHYSDALYRKKGGKEDKEGYLCIIV